MATMTCQTRIRPKNILYCTDFSGAAVHALPYAADLARHFGSKLWAMHVRMRAQGAEISNLETYGQGQAEAKLRTLVEEFSDIPQAVLAPEGSIWSSVEEAIKEQGIDLLVIGTRGRTGIRKFLLGSLAEEMFRRAPCAVLTVGPHVPTVPSASKQQFSEIICATDFGEHSVAAAGYAISLAQEYQAKLTLLHVMPEPLAGDLRVVIDELERAAENRLRELLPPEGELWCDPSVLVVEGPVPEQILQVADDKHAGLIVLGIHRPDGFADTHLSLATAHKVVSQAACPVLTVRS